MGFNRYSLDRVNWNLNGLILRFFDFSSLWGVKGGGLNLRCQDNINIFIVLRNLLSTWFLGLGIRHL
jgi:hypothetical protein